MNRQRLALFIIPLLTMIPHSIHAQDKDKLVLTVKEANYVRKACTEGLGVGFRISETSGFPIDVLNLPKELTELHKKKRIAVLKLLLDIVKGGRASDGISAAAFVTALEGEPELAATGYAHATEKDFDNESQAPDSTMRFYNVKMLEKLLAKLEKK